MSWGIFRSTVESARQYGREWTNNSCNEGVMKDDCQPVNGRKTCDLRDNSRPKWHISQENNIPKRTTSELGILLTRAVVCHIVHFVGSILKAGGVPMPDLKGIKLSQFHRRKRDNTCEQCKESIYGWQTKFDGSGREDGQLTMMGCAVEVWKMEGKEESKPQMTREFARIAGWGNWTILALFGIGEPNWGKLGVTSERMFFLIALPADGPAVQLFIATKAATVQPATLAKYLTSLRTIHTEHRWSLNALNNPILKRLVAAAERRYGSRARKTHQAITREILTDILEQLPDDHDGRMLAAAFTLAWTAFMHCSEFTVVDGAEFDPSVNLTEACISNVDKP
ncbi:hypothetical protein DFH08DRAFT_825010 [Mycena albidolilacea]|uniref:Uncharacterized protein n=1 Tax=Mycena albidolilacea TaxID=1033008 RepID=A0AAD6Z2S7_9AGAR|nr:hypothetical protein DFH08DRAFT_825010 [Mycena albidolilacea]